MSSINCLNCKFLQFKIMDNSILTNVLRHLLTFFNFKGFLLVVESGLGLFFILSCFLFFNYYYYYYFLFIFVNVTMQFFSGLAFLFLDQIKVIKIEVFYEIGKKVQGLVHRSGMRIVRYYFPIKKKLKNAYNYNS